MSALFGGLFNAMLVMVIVGVVFLLACFNDSGKSYLVGFECGFDTKVVVTGSLVIRYFMLVVVFLVLDMEVGVFALLSVKSAYVSVGVLMVVFFSGWLYLLGTLYEWGVGSLSWGG